MSKTTRVIVSIMTVTAACVFAAETAKHNFKPKDGYVPDAKTAIKIAVAVFGALSFWWMGEHGSPSIDTSEHVWFANDQLAVRFIEEIDFDYAATDATAALITAAS